MLEEIGGFLIVLAFLLLGNFVFWKLSPKLRRLYPFERERGDDD